MAWIDRLPDDVCAGVYVVNESEEVAVSGPARGREEHVYVENLLQETWTEQRRVITIACQVIAIVSRVSNILPTSEISENNSFYVWTIINWMCEEVVQNLCAVVV